MGTLAGTSSSAFRGFLFLIRAVLLAGVVYAGGFLLFLFMLPSPNANGEAEIHADAIVALTGQDRRLRVAVTLLERGAGARLLISGVNESTKKEELRELLDGGRAFDCCVDLGFVARDTRGNAREAAEWARTHGYQSLIVVTGYDHMPRSLLEFSAEMPEVTLIPYPVGREDGNNPISGRLDTLHQEYAKYLASWARITLQPAEGVAG
jgi:uncharacterized SAM-binding protein YcdF (DUF218 family)